MAGWWQLAGDLAAALWWRLAGGDLEDGVWPAATWKVASSRRRLAVRDGRRRLVVRDGRRRLAVRQWRRLAAVLGLGVFCFSHAGMGGSGVFFEAGWAAFFCFEKGTPA
jgi:hypothetical protein